MVYMLMIYTAEADWVHRPVEELMSTLGEHKVLENELRAAGKFLGGGGLALANSASTVRFQSGEPLITDGPFAETKEQFGGFYLVEAETLQEALSYAQRIPGVETRAIEVREITHFSPA